MPKKPAHKKGKKIMKNLVEPIKSKKDVRRIESYLERQSGRNRLIFVLGINTGLRVSDILGLNIEHVKNKNYVEIIEKKTGKYKRFPLNKKLKELIYNYLQSEKRRYGKKEKNEPLFTGKKNKRLGRSQVYRFLKKACSALNISANVGTHTMRKTFGYFFYKQNNNTALLQKILNHSNPAITMRYIGIDQDEIDTSYKNFQL